MALWSNSGGVVLYSLKFEILNNLAVSGCSVSTTSSLLYLPFVNFEPGVVLEK